MSLNSLSSNDLVRQRIRSCDRAFRAIDASRKILSQMENFVVETVSGDFPDIEFIANLTHDLRGNVDELLVGLIEARTAPDINNKETEA